MNASLNRSRLMYMLISVLLIFAACKSQKTLITHETLVSRRDSSVITGAQRQSIDVKDVSFDTTEGLTTVVDVTYSLPDSAGNQYLTRVVYAQSKTSSVTSTAKDVAITNTDSLSSTTFTAVKQQTADKQQTKKRQPPGSVAIIVVLSFLVIYVYRKPLLRLFKRLLLHF